MKCRSDDRHPPAVAAIVLANRFRRKAEEPQRTPAERMGEENDEADWDEQQGAKLRLPQSPEPEPKPERKQGQRHRQGEIDEAEHEWMAEGERQREGDRRRQSVMNFASDPQHPRHGHRRDRHHDQLGCRLDADQLGQGYDQKVDAKISDRQPMEREPLLKDRTVGQVEPLPCSGPYGRRCRPAAVSAGKAVAPTPAGSSRATNGRPSHHGRGVLRQRGSRRLLGQEVRRVDQAWSRLPSRRRRSAFSLMKPSASRWS